MPLQPPRGPSTGTKQSHHPCCTRDAPRPTLFAASGLYAQRHEACARVKLCRLCDHTGDARAQTAALRRAQCGHTAHRHSSNRGELAKRHDRQAWTEHAPSRAARIPPVTHSATITNCQRSPTKHVISVDVRAALVLERFFPPRLGTRWARLTYTIKHTRGAASRQVPTSPPCRSARVSQWHKTTRR